MEKKKKKGKWHRTGRNLIICRHWEKQKKEERMSRRECAGVHQTRRGQPFITTKLRSGEKKKGGRGKV